MSIRRLAGTIAMLGLAACRAPEQHRDPAPIANTSGAAQPSARCTAIPPPPPVGSDCTNAGSHNSDGTSKQLSPPPPGQPGKWLVLDYNAFGPQAMAYELIGFQWWSWEGGGSWENCDQFDIHVVVFNPEYRDQVAQLYPTVKDHSDNRLVAHAMAIDFLAVQIADLAGDASLRSLRAELVATRAAIDDCLR